jgi:hypothetical protein
VGVGCKKRVQAGARELAPGARAITLGEHNET